MGSPREPGRLGGRAVVRLAFRTVALVEVRAVNGRVRARHYMAACPVTVDIRGDPAHDHPTGGGAKDVRYFLVHPS